eukprot:Skav217366  [mRNA]  locus=scaffold1119:18046:20629:+ [translate_table: standard]
MGVPSVDGDGSGAQLYSARCALHGAPVAALRKALEPGHAPLRRYDNSYVSAHTLCDVSAGSELRISYRRAGAGSAQGFFATYGFIEEAQEVCCTELRLEPWDGPGKGSIVCLSSTQSLRRLLSHFRAEVCYCYGGGLYYHWRILLDDWERWPDGG